LCAVGRKRRWQPAEGFAGISKPFAGLFVVVAILAGWPAETAVMENDAAVPVLTVGLRNAALHPGQVGIVVVNASSDVTAVEGTAFERTVRFWPAGRGRWHGLLAAGLETAPGPYRVAIRATGTLGVAMQADTTVRLERKVYETRRLRVAQQFVNPPAGEVARIQEDARILAEVFGDSTPERLWRGAFQPPVSGTATSSFGRLTILNGQPNGRHQGADFRAASGTPILAPNAGRVVLVRDLYFAGNTVILDHGLGLFSLFAHLSRTNVGMGQLVARGEVLGLTGATGRVTGPHVHWAVRMDALSVDPISLISVLADLAEPADVLATH
jgi:murein DD-endopeptidase MepM/ murein hydrolase activator NlpD